MPIANGYRSNSEFFGMRIAAQELLALILSVSCAAHLCAQTIQIKLINGETGRPVAGACVGAWMKAKMPLYVVLHTDKSGIAELGLTQNDNEVHISYNPTLGCGGTGATNPVVKYGDTLTTTTGDYPSCSFPERVPNARWKELDFSTEEVLQHGVAAENTCGHVTASPQPGQVVLFVRRRNHQEKRHDCLAGEFPILCW